MDNFLSLKTRQELSNWLNVPDRKLRYLLYVLPESQKYQSFEIKKRNGSNRKIDAPCAALKEIQCAIANAIEVASSPSPLAHGYVHRRSILTNASAHTKKKFVVACDISDFFSSITFPRVLGLFLSPPFNFPKPLAVVLAQACTFNGCLPQGAPTSPAISNVICRSLDRKILSFALKAKCHVSRYADDICFSSNHPKFLSAISKDGEPSEELSEIFSDSGFKINLKKFKVMHRSCRQTVTGIVVNDGISIPREWRRQLRTMLFLQKKHGNEQAQKIIYEWSKNAIRSRESEIQKIISGKLSYLYQVDKFTGKEITRSFAKSYPGQISFIKEGMAKVEFRLLSEGPTDLLHIEAAMQHFHSQDQFLTLRPRYKNFSGDNGDMDVMETLRRISKSDIPELTIGVFDCDNQALMKRLSVNPGDSVQIGDNVFAIFLAPKTDGQTDFCIESLYDRSDSTKFDKNGRRIFFSDEFDHGHTIDRSGRYERDNPNKKSVVVTGKVMDIERNESVLLSKMDFAKNIHERTEPFEAVDFSGFEPFFIELALLVQKWVSSKAIGH